MPSLTAMETMAATSAIMPGMGRLVVAREDLLEADPADADARHQQDEAEHDGGEALDALVSVGMGRVGLAPAEPDARKAMKVARRPRGSGRRRRPWRSSCP